MSQLPEIDPGIGVFVRIMSLAKSTMRYCFGGAMSILEKWQGNRIKSLVKRPFTYRQVIVGLSHLTEVSRSFNPDILVGINRGGAIIGGMVGKRLKKWVFIIEIKHDFDGPIGLSIDKKKLEGKRVILIDDRIHTGLNLRRARSFIIDQGAEVQVLVFARPENWHEQLYPNDYAFEVSSPSLPFPWEPGTSSEWK